METALLKERQARAERYLARPGRLQEVMHYKQIHLRAVRGRLRSSFPTGEVRGTGIADPTGSAAAEAEELSAQIARLQTEIDRARMDAQRLIARLPNAQSRELMEMRYLSLFKWEEISEALAVSPRTALRRHQRALGAIAALLEDADGEEGEVAFLS